MTPLQHELPRGTEENVTRVFMFPRRRKSYSRVHSDHGLLYDYVGGQCLLGTPTAHCLPGTPLRTTEDSSVYSNIGVEEPKQL